MQNRERATYVALVALIILALLEPLFGIDVQAQQRWNPDDPYMRGGPGWDRGNQRDPRNRPGYNDAGGAAGRLHQALSVMMNTHLLNQVSEQRYQDNIGQVGDCRELYEEVHKHVVLEDQYFRERNAETSNDEFNKAREALKAADECAKKATQEKPNISFRFIVVLSADGTRIKVPLPGGLPGEPMPYGNYNPVGPPQTSPPSDPGAFGAQPGQRLFYNPDIWLHTGNTKLGLLHILDEHVPGAPSLKPEGVFYTNNPDAIKVLIDTTILANRQIYGGPKVTPNGVKIFYAKFEDCPICGPSQAIGTSFGKPVNWVQVIVAPRNVVITAYPTSGPPP